MQAMKRGGNGNSPAQVIHYRGHVIKHVPDNGHIWIYPEEKTSGGIVSHITCSQPSTDEDLKRMLDLKLRMRDRAFDDYFLGGYEFDDDD